MRKAFTLIELLIVVAIVAILAVIAVPNFVVSQTRKMSAQSLANLRALDSALSAYRADYQGSLPATAMNFNWIDRWGYYQILSTPIPYMSSVPRDPFLRLWAEKMPVNTGWPNYYCPYDLWDVNIAVAIKKGTTAPGMWGPISATMSGLSNATWIDTYVLPACRNGNRLDCSYFLRGWGPQYLGIIINGIPQGGNTYVVPYDPTNGAVSYGNLFWFH